MTFNYEEIASLDYFDSRDVVARITRINERIEKEMDSKNTYEVAHLRLERLVLKTLLEELEDDMPTSFGEPISTDTNRGVQGFAAHYAEDLKEDYTEVEILGHTFYLRD